MSEWNNAIEAAAQVMDAEVARLTAVNMKWAVSRISEFKKHARHIRELKRAEELAA